MRIGTPLAASSDAAVCRRSWSLILGRPALAATLLSEARAWRDTDIDQRLTELEAQANHPHIVGR